MRVPRLTWIVSLVLAASCSGDSFENGVRLICESPVEAQDELALSQTHAEQASVLSRWIAARLDDPEARALFAGLAPVPPGEKAARLREAATREGVERCPLADVWEVPMTIAIAVTPSPEEP